MVKQEITRLFILGVFIAAGQDSAERTTAPSALAHESQKTSPIPLEASNREPLQNELSILASSLGDLTGWLDARTPNATDLVKSRGDLVSFSAVTGSSDDDEMLSDGLNSGYSSLVKDGFQVPENWVKEEAREGNSSAFRVNSSDHVNLTSAELSERITAIYGTFTQEKTTEGSQTHASSNETQLAAKRCSSIAVGDNGEVNNYDNSSLEGTNPPVLSQQTYAYITETLDRVRLPWDVISGLLTLTSTCIYLLPGMRSPTGCYLVSVNFLETLSALTGVVGLWWRTVDGPEVVHMESYNYVQLVFAVYANLCFRRCVYWLAVIVSSERVFAVKWPLKARYGKLVRFPALCILGDVAVTMAFHAYIPLSYGVARTVDTCQYYTTFTDLYLQQADDFQIVSNAAKYIFAYLPLLGGACINIALYLALSQQSRTQLSLCAGHEEARLRRKKLAERKLALTIWFSNTLFTLLSLPSNTIHLVSTSHATFGLGKRDHYLYLALSQGALLFVDVSRLTSFLSYVALSSAFRRNLMRAATPWSWRERGGPRRGRHGNQQKATREMHLKTELSSGSVPSVTGSLSVSCV